MPDYESPVTRQQRAHRSIRRFTDRPVDSAMLQELIACGQAAATSSFIQATSVVRVTRPAARQAIAAAAGGQVWIERAPEFLVWCADLRRIDAAARHVGLGGLEGYSEHGLAAVVDVALMAQNTLLAAESLGLGGVYIGGLRNAPQVVVEQLALPYWVTPVFGMCLGWPDENPEVKPRMPVAMVLHEDVYRDPDEQAFADYDAVMAAYYATRSSNTKLSDWRSAAAAAMQGKKREHMLEFLRGRGFFLR